MPNLEWTIESRYHADQPASQATEQYWNSPKVQAYFSAKDLEKTKLKKLVRAGVPDGLRGEIYAKILKLDQLAEYEKNYEVALTRTHGSVIPSEPLPPTFGGKSHAAQLALNKIGSRTTEHIRCIIAHDFPALEYCPFITPCVELLAHHMRDEDELLGAIYAMVKRSTQRSPTSTSQSASSSSSQQDEWGYFPTYRKGVKLMLRAFGNLLYTSNKRLHLHLTELHSTSPDPVWADWLTTMLIGHIPQPALWRLLDAFVLEGWKALFRFAAGMLMCQRDVLLAQPDLGHVNALLTPENPIFTPPTVLLKQAESITVSRSDVRKLKDHHKTLAAISHDDHISESQYRYQRGLPKLISSSTSTPTSSSVLTDEHWIALWSWIPPAKRVESLELVFTTKEHGTHSANLFRRCEGRAPMILVVETLKGEVFGAYLSARWPSGEEEGGRGEWFGNGETFLFSLVPYAKLYPWIGRTIDFEAYSPTQSPNSPSSPSDEPSSATTDTSSASSSMGETKPATTTGRPPYSPDYLRDRASMFVMVANKAIHIGGGGAHTGLYINPTLTAGETGPCQTFENAPLTGGGKEGMGFECHVVEVFAFN